MRTCPDCGTRTYYDNYGIMYCPLCGWEDVKAANKYTHKFRQKKFNRTVEHNNDKK